MNEKKLKKLEWHTEKRKINDLVPFEENPRQMTERQKEDLQESLEKFNLVEIPAINTDNKIIAGHQRLKIMQLLGRGEETIDVRVPNRKLTGEEFREYNLRSNKNSGEWDYDLLANVGEEMLLDVGFEKEELDNIFGLDVKEDIFDVDREYGKIKEPKTKLGEVYQLGDHRMMCGDATKNEDVEKLMDGKKADVIFTDPPYNVDYKGKGKNTSEGILGDKQEEEEFVEFSEKWIRVMKANLKTGGVYYICSGYSSYPTFLYALRVNQLNFSQPIVWVKNNTAYGWNDYRYKHEMVIKGKSRKTKKKKAQPILYGWNGGKHYFIDTRFESDVWEIKRRASNIMVHPTQKPLELIGRAIRNSSKRDETVLDLFGGSGSTLISAEKEGRKCYVVELDPKYCDIIIKRWEEFTGKEAVKVE